MNQNLDWFNVGALIEVSMIQTSQLRSAENLRTNKPNKIFDVEPWNQTLDVLMGSDYIVLICPPPP